MTDVRKNLIIIVFFLSGIIFVLLFLNFNASWKKPGGKGIILPESSETIPARLPKKLSTGPVGFFGFKNFDQVIFYEKSEPVLYETDFAGKKRTELAKVQIPKNAKSASFSPDGRKLAYYSYDNAAVQGQISISEPDGSNSRTIFLTRIKNLNLTWPKDELIVFYPEDKNYPVFSITPDGGQFRRLTEEESIIYLTTTKEIAILQEMGIEVSQTKLSPLNDYLLFINAGDGKLYSLRL